jgi:hypothetical protein
MPHKGLTKIEVRMGWVKQIGIRRISNGTIKAIRMKNVIN